MPTKPNIKCLVTSLLLIATYGLDAIASQNVSGRKIKPLANNVVTQSLQNSTLSKKISVSSTQNQRIPKTVKAIHEKNGTPALMRGKLSSSIVGQNLRDTVDQAWNQLRNNKALKIDTVDKGNFLFQKMKQDRFRKAHAWYQQAHNGIPVWGKQVIFHLDENHQVYQFQGDYLANTEVDKLEPGIPLDFAVELAAVAVNAINPQLTSAELNYFDSTAQKLRLSYKLELIDGVDKRWTLFIDAWDGSVLHILNNIHSAGELVTATGKNLNGEDVQFTAWFENSRYYLIDPSVPTIDDNYSPLSQGPNSSGDTYIYDAKQGNGFTVDYVQNNQLNNAWNATAVTALQNTHRVYNYFLQTFDRQSIDNNGSNLLALIHFEQAYNNAFWNGSMMVYGDGDGSVFTPLVNCLDVAAHEMTHGIIEHSANLIYQNQSGALNESFADVFAVLLDDDDWTIGEDCTIISPGYLRSLSNPASGVDEQPAKMSDYVNLPNTLAGDNGGVHINSGIPNHAAYLFIAKLMASGLSKNDAYARAEQIYYRALNFYLHASSRFVDARRALIAAAEELYGDVEVAALQYAWDAVEVFDFGIEPEPQVPTSVKEIPGNDVLVYLTPVGGSLDLYVHVYNDADATSVDVNNYFGPLNVGTQFGLNIALFETRPAAVTDQNGTRYYFVSWDNLLYYSRGSGASIREQDIGDVKVWSIATSPNGRYIAYTRDIQEPVIHVYDRVAKNTDSYSIEPVNYQSSSENSGNTLLYADSLNFDFSSNKIVFDALSCISLPGDSCSNGGYQYWSIGVLDIPSRRVINPMPDQNPGIDFGFPTFATNNNYVIAMDVIEYDDSGASPTYHSKTISFNYETQEMKVLSDNGIVSQPFFATPSFWGDDQHMTMLLKDSSTGFSADTFAKKIALTEQWSINQEEPVLLSNNPIRSPIMHRAVHRELTSDLRLNVDVINFGDVIPSTIQTQELIITNSGDFDIELIEITIDNAAFTHNAVNSTIRVNESLPIKIQFNATTVASYNTLLRIKTDVSSSSYDVALFAKVVLEGNGNNATTQKGAAGCSVGHDNKVDLTLILLVVLAAAGAIRRKLS